MAGLVDVDKEMAKLDKEQAKLEKELERTQGKLANEKFLNNAPADVVAKEREKQEMYKAKLEKIRENKTRLEELR
jgi:valyl-tRNA synthetase